MKFSEHPTCVNNGSISGPSRIRLRYRQERGCLLQSRPSASNTLRFPTHLQLLPSIVRPSWRLPSGGVSRGRREVQLPHGAVAKGMLKRWCACFRKWPGCPNCSPRRVPASRQRISRRRRIIPVQRSWSSSSQPNPDVFVAPIVAGGSRRRVEILPPTK